MKLSDIADGQQQGPLKLSQVMPTAPTPAPEQPGFLASMLGNIAGQPSAMQRSMAMEIPHKPGMTLGQSIPKNYLDNPMLWAMGTGNVGVLARPPRIAPDQAALAGRGVQMTPGQVVGGFAKSAEDIAQKFPVLGHFIQNAKDRSITTFNRATIDQALEPIGRRLPATVNVGHDAVKWAADTLSSAYDHVLNRIPSVARDTELATDISQIRAEAQRNPYVRDRLLPEIHDRIDTPLSNSGRMQGADIKSIISYFKEQARGYARGTQDERNLAMAMHDVVGSLTDAIERQYPAEAAHLHAIDKAYAMQTRIEQAAGRRTGSSGVFTPTDLLAASKGQATGVRRGGVARQFAHGDALFQKWGEIGQRVLPSKAPDSGTATGLLSKDLLYGAGNIAAGTVAPHVAAGVLGSTAAASIPYIPAVTRGIQRSMEAARPFRSLGPRAGIAATMPGQFPNAPVTLPGRPAAATPAQKRRYADPDYIEPPPRPSVGGP